MNPFLPASAQSRLVLASASPRRRELLRALGFEFSVTPSAYHEADLPGEDPAALVRRHALGKARDVASRRKGDLVIGADTAVVAGKVLGKPADAEDARAMLRALSGREHEVITGLALVQVGADGARREAADVSRTRVRFRALGEAEIAAYVASGEPFDKAGAYGIQGLASQFVSAIAGCYFNVMGLPMELLTRMLRAWAQDERSAEGGA